MMTANVTPATREVPDARELSPEELDGVSGGWLCCFGAWTVRAGGGGQGGQNDPAQMFQQIMQQLTQGQG
jgi:hypothetical protein